MGYHWLIPLTAALACLFLGTAVYRFAPRSLLSEVFAFLSVTLVFWNLNFVALYAIANKSLAFEVARTMRVGSMLLPAAVFHLAVAVCRSPSRKRSVVLVVDYVLAGVFIILNAQDLIVRDIRLFTWGYQSIGTTFYDIYTIYVLVNFIAAVGLMIREFASTSDPRTRVQLKFWLVGLLVSLPLGLTNLLPVYGIKFYPLGNLGSAVWSGIVAYAIVRHRLMDIDVIVTKGIAYLGCALIVFGPLCAMTLCMEQWTFGEINYDFSAGVLVVLLAGSTVFPFLQTRVEKGLAKSLFRQKYQNRTELTKLAHSIVRILDRDKLVRELCDTLVEIFQLERIALFALDGLRGGLQLERSVGIRPVIEVYPSDHSFTRWLASQTEPVIRAEVLSESKERSGAAGGVAFETNGWEVIVPLVNSRVLSGFLALGRKRDLQAFGAADLAILSNVGAEASVALENARLYSELRRSQDVITRAGRLSALGTLAAGIAHEIRNPLVSIQTFFQLAPKRLDDEEFMTSFLGLAEGEVQRISNLITELLTFAKSPAVAIKEVELDDVINRTVMLIAPQAHTQRVQIRTRLSRGMMPVLADSEQIMQVLLNIVLNGVQATPPGGTVTIETRQSELHGETFCQIEVRDSGPGIPAETQESIFNPFFTTKDKGTGLGLPIAHRIVAECGGFISVESIENEGARFFINLPPAVCAGELGDVPRVRLA